MSRIPVGILGASGLVGQAYAHLLEHHPLFEIALLSASPKWEGKTYGEALLGPPYRALSKDTLNMVLQPARPLPVLFSAIESSVAQSLEFPLAEQGAAVFSHASIHRLVSDIPLMIPEINPDHLSLIHTQRKKRGWKGFIVVKPNCTLQSVLLPLYPLHQLYGLKKVIVTTMQAISGAGRDFSLKNNIFPYIEGEEEKLETEPHKILSCPKEQMIFSVHSNRVPIYEGHLACISAGFEKSVDVKEVRNIWKHFPSPNLFSAPKRPFYYLDMQNRPQPLLDTGVGNGMSIALGRLRRCSIFDLRFTALSHNLIRGAAGGHLLNAELAVQKGYIRG